MNVQRIHIVGGATSACHTLIAGSGEMSDFQYLCDLLDTKAREELVLDDGFTLTARELWNYTGNLLYNRRCKVDPLWNTILVAGSEKGKPFLGRLDMYGTTVECDYAASGFGMYFSVPMLRDMWKPDMTEEEATELVKKCLQVLLFRDARTINKYQIAKITLEGEAVVSKPFSLDTAGKWNSGELAINDPK